ncbi:MAG TPA: hypothetical protein VHO25_10340 [Polyangiaceae bacterium]|nr:hypothetical protein [Polyangiaceae bacterium]
MEWEMKYTAKKNGWPPTRPDLAKSFQVNGLYASAWNYHFPSPVQFLGQQINGIVYGTAALEHVVFVISSPIRHRGDVEPAVDAVINALKTVTKTPEPLDLKAISREVKSGSERWCSERPPANAQ